MPAPLLPAACLFRNRQLRPADVEHLQTGCRAGAAPAQFLLDPSPSPMHSPGTRLARRSAPYGSPSALLSLRVSPSAGSLHGSIAQSPCSLQACSPGGVGAKGRVVSKVGRRRQRVRFSSPLNTCHDVVPYEEVYGTHPDLFNFDASGDMVPTSPMGMASPLSSPEECPLCGSPCKGSP
mmetsp:Transcript_103250/g.301167  ORF Transcript_103250/g.301167 Transcript_103250/m.301167 type:complete len:179 (+) Transcript_103250:73-609(+)